MAIRFDDLKSIDRAQWQRVQRALAGLGADPREYGDAELGAVLDEVSTLAMSLRGRVVAALVP